MNTGKIVNFFFEIATLRRLTRSHRQVIAEVSDNISDHCFRVAIIGMILAQLENCDQNKVLKMCLFHDLAEARTGDANLINQQYVEMREEGARQDQLTGLPIGKEIISLLREFEEQETKEAISAKDADKLDQMILQQEYFFKDSRNGKIWQNYAESSLQTESAKNLAEKIEQTNPLDWFYRLVEKKTGNKID